MAENAPYKRGSEWRKWDLHIHTPLSQVQHYGGDTDVVWEKFISDLESLPPEFKVIGINDYLFIDGYEKVCQFKASGRLQNIETIFPVIEFRIKKFAGHRDFKRINYHVIFSDVLDSQLIRQQFLNQLFGKYKLNSDFESIVWSGYVTPESLADLGKKIKESVPPERLPEFGTDLEEGFNNINFNEEKLVELLTSSTYIKDNFVTAIGKTEWDAFSWGDSSIGEKKTVINSVDLVFTASESIDAYYNAKTKLAENMVNSFLLDCSDAHDFSSSTKKDRIGNCFSWIKADPSFEGLKLLKYEPERVKIQERNPSDSKSNRTIIDYVSYKKSTSEEVKVLISKDLSSIIGVRGSGKSTLIKNIAYNIDPIQYKEKDKRKPYQLLNFKVHWADVQIDQGGEESPKSVFYVPQNYLSSLAYEDGDQVRERDLFLTKLLKKNVKFANAIQSFEAFSSQNKIIIEGIIEKLLKADLDIKDNQSLLKKLGSKVEIEKEIEHKNNELKRYKTISNFDISDDEISAFSLAQTELTSHTKAIHILKQDKAILLSLKETGANILISNKQFGLLSSNRQEVIRLELNKSSNEDLNSLIDSEIAKIDVQMASIQKDSIDKQEFTKSLEEKINQSKALHDLTKELGSLREVLKRIQELREKLLVAQNGRNDAINHLAVAYGDFDTQQEAIYKTVEFIEDFSFLKVEIVAKYNVNQIKTFVERYINTRDSEPSIKTDEDIKTLFSDNPQKLTTDVTKKIIKNLLDGSLKIKVEAENVGNVISLLLRNRYDIDYLNSVKTKDGETRFKDMTGGQKAIALLELIFRFDDEKYPILIDQPEDDLDVGGVATDLVSFIKSEKDERQIIIVSHNASLVICSDTENVIVTNIEHLGSGKHDFNYATGSIENVERRSDIIRVLEGGKDALSRRMQKLRV